MKGETLEAYTLSTWINALIGSRKASQKTLGIMALLISSICNLVISLWILSWGCWILMMDLGTWLHIVTVIVKFM